jgi:cobalt-zinc-cadmium efflux system membrane fusion protein
MKFDLSKNQFLSKQALSIGVVLLAGLLAGIYILRAEKTQTSGDAHGRHAEEAEHSDEHQHAANAGEPQKGPHGGRLFTANGYNLELTIFEQGVEPQFRLYTYQNGKPADPNLTQATVTLERLGAQPQIFSFRKETDYLKGDAVVEEPHSFTVTIAAQSGGKSYSFGFEQVEARVTMTDAQLKSNGVQIGTAGPARIKTALQLIGEIRLNEDRTVRIVPRFSGVVESVSASAGDKVRKGQVIAVVSSQTLADQRSELLATQKRAALARTTFEREKKLWEEKISAEQDYLQARQVLQEAEIAEQSARQKLASLGTALPESGSLILYEIRAPIDGVITEKNIAAGEVLKDDANIFVVADLSTVWVELTVYAKDLNAVRTGQHALVKATAFNAEATGTLSYVGSVVGDQTRTAKARLVLPNRKGLWRPGLPVNVNLVADEIEVPVAVAADAVQTLRDWTVVFGRYGDQFEARPITLGRSDGKTVEVLNGLNPGERYAASNSYLIKADIGKAGASHDH